MYRLKGLHVYKYSTNKDKFIKSSIAMLMYKLKGLHVYKYSTNKDKYIKSSIAMYNI